MESTPHWVRTETKERINRLESEKMELITFLLKHSKYRRRRELLRELVDLNEFIDPIEGRINEIQMKLIEDYTFTNIDERKGSQDKKTKIEDEFYPSESQILSQESQKFNSSNPPESLGLGEPRQSEKYSMSPSSPTSYYQQKQIFKDEYSTLKKRKQQPKIEEDSDSTQQPDTNWSQEL